MRQKYTFLPCEVSRILQVSFQHRITCLLYVVYLFVLLLKAHHIVFKIVKITYNFCRTYWQCYIIMASVKFVNIAKYKSIFLTLVHLGFS
jgi:hypothetical protein